MKNRFLNGNIREDKKYQTLKVNDSAKNRTVDINILLNRIKVDKNHRIILEPLVEIPAREKWLFDNKPALQAVKQGIKDAKEGKVYDLGCIAKYLEDEDDDK